MWMELMPAGKTTFFALEGAEVGRHVGRGLDAVHLAVLDPAPAEPRLVATATVLLA